MAALDPRQHRGWEVLRLSTDELSLDVLPGLGGTITSLTRTRDTAELLWSTPWGLRRAGAYALPGSSEATMIDSFPGGWQTLFPNGGESASGWIWSGTSTAGPMSGTRWRPAVAADFPGTATDTSWP